MKILFVCQGMPKISDGSLLIVYHLSNFLSKRHQIDLIYLKQREEIVSPLHFFRDTIDISFKPKRRLLNRLKNLFSLKPNLVSYYWSREMKDRIAEITKEKRYDVVIALTMNMAQFVSRLSGVKKIVMPHDAEHLIYRKILEDAKGVLNKTKAWLWWRKVYIYQKRVYPCFDRCVVASERDKKALTNLSNRINAEVLPSGVDTDFFKSTKKKVKKDNLIFTGVMNTWSNIDAVTYFVKEIFPLIEKEISSITLYIAGKRPSDRVLKLASKNIIVTGEVPDIRPYLEEALILIAPFRVGTGLKHKILEAMAMEVAVVSTTLGANGIEVKSGENIILGDTPRDFAASIINLYNNSQLRERIVKNALVLVKEKYNWDRIGKIFEDML